MTCGRGSSDCCGGCDAAVPLVASLCLMISGSIRLLTQMQSESESESRDVGGWSGANAQLSALIDLASDPVNVKR